MKKAPISVGSTVTPKSECYMGFVHGDILTVVELKKRFAMCVKGNYANQLNNIPPKAPRYKLNKGRLEVV